MTQPRRPYPIAGEAWSPLGTGADYRASVEVQGFESALGEAATLDAVWTVRRVRDGKVQTGRTTVREAAAGQGYDAREGPR